MDKDSNDFLLSTAFSPVSVPESSFIQSPLPSGSALIPTAPSPPLLLRHSLPSKVHKDVFLMYICHIKILSGLPGRGHTNGLKRAELVPGARKEQPILGLRPIRCLCSANEVRVEIPTTSERGNRNSVWRSIGEETAFGW